MPMFYLIEKRNDLSLLHEEKIKASDYAHAWQQAKTLFPDMEVDVIDAAALDAVRKDKNLILHLLANTLWLNEDLPDVVQEFKTAFQETFLTP